MTPTARLLRELIALPSVNPAFVPAGDPSAGERRVAEFTAATAASAGLDVDFQKVLPGRANLLVTLVPRGPRRGRVLLAPHMDTVTVASARQFTPVRRGDRLYGRGACDTKGSLAAMLRALIELARSGSRPQHTEITLAALVDEESSQSGSRALAASGLKADLAVVGEPTRLKVVTAHKGDLWLELTTHGKAAHGSRPELGRSAIADMARAVSWLEGDYARQLRRRRHPLLGHATINVGTIQGGRQPNIVPDRCTIKVDRRTLPGENDAAVKRELVRGLRHHGITVRLVDYKGVPSEPMETNCRLPLVREFLHANGQRRPAGVHFFSDAGVLAAAGIPSVLFGPGDIAQAHTAEEFVSLSELERARETLVRFLRSLP
ncbi:MAG TPA: M20/M25/M40 family metallo-hydrolase [Methylomirabilota bacterium]|nr:M20/M25/M40 family metallo-hydrolase [Methylomirabilota bacterium]